MLTAYAAGIFALQLLNIMVHIFKDGISMTVWSCFFCKYVNKSYTLKDHGICVLRAAVVFFCL